MMKNEPCMGGTALPATSPAIIQQEKIATILQDIGQRTLPANYEAVIDGAFAHRLKDPDSRKIEYVGQPHGSAVCGMVNAKNSFGGYTGRHQFLAYFSTTGKLEYLKSYEPKFLENVLYLNELDGQLLRKCGLFSHVPARVLSR